jgi:endonuclease YncB( thermonuclease family)
MRPLLLLTVLALAPLSVLADFTGRVVKFQDGDTLTVLVNKTQIRVRLDAIDAPESAPGFRQTFAAVTSPALRREAGQD